MAHSQTQPAPFYPLDENGFFGVKMTPSAEGLELVLSCPDPHSHIASHLRSLLAFHQEGATFSFGNAGKITLPVSQSPISVRLAGQDFGTITPGADGPQAHPSRRLSVFETRMLGRSPAHGHFRLAGAMPPPPTLLTDLHTHISAQLTGQELLELGKAHHVAYPTAILDMLDIPYDRARAVDVPRRKFLPHAHRNQDASPTEKAVDVNLLPARAQQRLAESLSMPPDKQSTFQAIEEGYWLREPFTKDLALLPDILRAVANSYREQHIRYAELSSNAVIEPGWLAKVHEVLPAIEKETGVQLRFLAGLPRNLPDSMLEARLEQIKRVAASPYVVGVDVLGFEMNKTSHLNKHLEHLAAWAMEQQPEFIFRIHAGENGKNPHNIMEVLKLADRSGIRVRIGHAIYGMNEEVLQMARKLGDKGQLIIEFNPDSNMACNNIDEPNDIPLPQCIERKIPSVLGSDGAGFYLTSARQTAMAAMICGMIPQGFTIIQATEEDHIARQARVFAQKSDALSADFMQKLHSLPPLPRAPAPNKALAAGEDDAKALDRQLALKKPIFVAGAGGNSWPAVGPAQQEVAVGFEKLLKTLDPAKVCFVTGRIKREGVGMELGKAIVKYNAQNQQKFDYIQVLFESDHVTDKPPGVTHTYKLNGPLLNLSGELTHYVKKHHGVGLFIGGEQFTRNFILDFDNHGIPFGLMREASGASADKARIYPHRAFTKGEGMVTHIVRDLPQVPADLRPAHSHSIL